MELKAPWLLYVGVAISVLLFILFIIFSIRKQKPGKGIKVANTDLFDDIPYIRNQIIIYRVFRVLLVAAIIAGIIASFVILARPYYLKKIKKEQYNRDIIICLDISSSVNDLNLKLVKELQDTVRSLNGERVGIVIFNTSSVILSPLSDDYEYTIEQLENIRKAIKVCESRIKYSTEDWLYWNNFLYGGTLVGNAYRGSSLIGDGLAGGLFSFPKDSEDRTKIIIFSTDNDANGEGYVNLQEAADLCKKNDVTVYGIGTKSMYAADREEMKNAVESTGGKFFLEENASTFHNIVEEIESKSASLVYGKIISKEVESPEKYFEILCGAVILLILTSIVLRRINIPMAVVDVLLIAFTALLYSYCIKPAHVNTMGPDFEVKRKSDYCVLFVIDNTVSMIANDGRNGTERIDNVKEDCKKIVDELDGAKIGVVSFNNDAMLLAPFSNNSEHIKNTIQAITPIDSFYAKGSSLDKPKEMIGYCAKRAGNKIAVIYISDGENTSEEPLGSLSELKKIVDDGVVLGYGTKEGGIMQTVDEYTGEVRVITDYSVYPFQDAVSKIDEKNLKTIASDMGVSYVNMNDGAGLNTVISRIKSKLNVKEEVKQEDIPDYIKIPENKGYYLAIPVLLLLLINAFYAVIRE